MKTVKRTPDFSKYKGDVCIENCTKEQYDIVIATCKELGIPIWKDLQYDLFFPLIYWNKSNLFISATNNSCNTKTKIPFTEFMSILLDAKEEVKEWKVEHKHGRSGFEIGNNLFHGLNHCVKFYQFEREVIFSFESANQFVETFTEYKKENGLN